MEVGESAPQCARRFLACSLHCGGNEVYVRDRGTIMNQLTLGFFAISFSTLALAACGSSSNNPDGGGGGDGGSGSSGGGASSGSGGSSGSSSGSSGGGFEAGAPITGLMDQTWVWVDVPEAHCRNGSATGFGVNANSASNKLMIFLEGGGACFNALTCGTNPSAASASTFRGGTAGIFSRTDMANPVHDWNFVDVPYCTGDVFAGNKPDGSVPGVQGTQQFVGYTNVAEFLKRIVPTFPGVTQVLLTGVSAGGFGAAANYPPVARAFAPAPVVLLDDSGPSMRDPYLATCLQQEQVNLWGFDSTILAECGSDCPDHNNYPVDAAKHVAKAFPSAKLGLVEATGDNTITAFFGFGQNNCTGSFTTPLSEPQFTAGLTDLRMQLSAYPNYGSFIFKGTRHTSLSTQSAFDTQTATTADGGSVLLKDWIRDLVVNGQVTNVGPP
jgi:hypothetical protein